MNDTNKGNSVALTQCAADLNKHVIKEQTYVRIALLIYTLLRLLSKSRETFPYNMKVPFRSVQSPEASSAVNLRTPVRSYGTL